AQHDGVSEVGGQALDGVQDRLVDHVAEQLALRVALRGGHEQRQLAPGHGWPVALARGPLDDLVATTFAFALPEECVPADGKQPALGRGSRGVLLPGAVGAEEGLLHEVLGVRRGAGQAEREAIDGVEVRQRLLLEGAEPVRHDSQASRISSYSAARPGWPWRWAASGLRRCASMASPSRPGRRSALTRRPQALPSSSTRARYSRSSWTTGSQRPRRSYSAARPKRSRGSLGLRSSILRSASMRGFSMGMKLRRAAPRARGAASGAPGGAAGRGRPAARRGDAEAFGEAQGIEGGVAERVVVEVDVDVAPVLWRPGRARDASRVARLAAALPRADARGPPVELRVGVAARVDRLRAVQPDVDEVCGELLGVGEEAG